MDTISKGKKMSLVPIIYTSLVLFFSLLLIIVAISYLTFKTRAKVNPIIAEEVRNHQKNLVVKKHIAHDLPQTRVNIPGTAVTNATYRNVERNNSEPGVKILPPDYFKLPPQEKERIYYSNNPGLIERERYANNRTTKMNGTKDFNSANSRIKIMNNSGKFSRRYENDVPQYRRERGQLNLGEYNLFNFYSDSPETDFSNITAAHHKAV